MTCDDMKNIVADVYELDDNVIDWLEFSYTKLVGRNNTVKHIRTNNHRELLNEKHLELSEINLKVRYLENDTVEEDCSCDLQFLLFAMTRVGEAIRQKLHWVPMDELVYLFIDGSGGHGTKGATIEYKTNSLENFNIQLVFQVPRTPYSNVLDLEVWCGLQAAVEKTHFMQRCWVNILVRSVFKTWEKGKSN